ncbi:MAG: CRISPR-associated helicase Cas3' [Mariprofundaceae bacterium]|nr:CRISPR-associated helicase Cas3' [Mariprofundaceae bacterium]
MPEYFKYWGKAKAEDDSGPAFHLLPYHCLDVAAVGQILLDPEKALCQRLAMQLEVEPFWLQSFFVFCLALHDLGKFSRAFQGLQQGLSSDLVKFNSRMPYTERHDTLGFWLWRKTLMPDLSNRYPDHSSWLKQIEPWMEIVTGHHGIPPKKSGGRVANFYQTEDESAASLFAQDILALFLSEVDLSPLLDKSMKQRLKSISWQMAGVAVLADWLGSNQDYFKYSDTPMELAEYWNNYALPSAETAIRAMPTIPLVREFQGINDLFSFIDQPTPLQQYAIEEPLTDGPQLFILEDVTGAGKTEAALVLTHRLLCEGLADGLFVALPTMATSNAMYERISKVYHRFYHEGDRPSLVLAHGARNLSDAFQESVLLSQQRDDVIYEDGQSGETQELSATAYCNAWLADNRKKALLADVGVGTLDQTLLAVLPARHQSLRLLGLSRKVLLVDEVHAYDSYMQTLLDALLEMHARQGGSVILLSATLPQTMRERLVAAFHRGLDKDAPTIGSSAYPLATHSSAVTTFEKSIDTRKEVKRSVTVVRLDSEEAAIAQIQEAVHQGQSVCWIRNTVKAARQSHRDLTMCDWLNEDHLHLFHSRFAMIDRQLIESDTLKRFGETSDNKERQGHVLIATQVVEQSLDLDFDLLITDLAPIDLIVQRAGRLRRHIRDAQGNRIREANAKDQRGAPVLYLFSPEPIKDADEEWLKQQQAGTQYVYPHIGQLWLTARLLLNKRNGQFTMPDDARPLIEGVYGEDVQEDIPPALQEVSWEAEVVDGVKKSMASLNVLKLNKGYTRSSGDWDEETRIPTRLTEVETVSVVLVRFVSGQLRPYAEGFHHAWALSVVNIPAYEWDKVSQTIPTHIKPLVDTLKKEEKALRWLEVFPLMAETNEYYSQSGGWQSETGEAA